MKHPIPSFQVNIAQNYHVVEPILVTQIFSNSDFLKTVLRAVFKYGRRVYFALRRKMLKPLDFINRPSEETDCICEAKVK